jgi:alanyl aminopeptidase
MPPTISRRSCLSSLVSFSLIALITAARPAGAAETELPRLDHTAVPTGEVLHLTLDPAKTDYSGTATVALQVRQSTDQVRFHARALTIDSATLSGAQGAVPVTRVEAMPPDQAEVHLAHRVAPGLYTLTLRFHNQYNTRAVALYRVVTEGTGYLFTQFEDTEAREAFPCWDEPEFKIPWQVALTVPVHDLAVSNTPILGEAPSASMKTVRFARTKPLPSYLVAICVGPFESVPIKGLSVPGRVITVRGASPMAAEAARVTPAILRSLEKYFGRPYPYEKLDLIAAPEFLYGAMENAGAIVFADRRLLLDPRAAGPEQRRDLTSVIAHEAAHQWFGDLVTMKWWDDLWLNESFASWMATKVMDDVHPEAHSGVTSLFAEQRAFTTDSRLSTRAMRGKVEGRTSLGQTANELTYNKGEAVLTMFEGWLGVPKFRAGVLEYLKAHEWGNAEGRDLWLALGHQSGDDVDAAMSSFLDQPGVPLVAVEPLEGGRVKLSQSRFLTLGLSSEASERWRIPVILRYPAGGELKTRRVWLTAADTTLDLGGTPAWIDGNAGASGYYRWHVPDAMLDAMAADRERLTPSEKIDVISNLTASLRAGTLHGERYIKLLGRFSDDPSPEVVRAVVEALNETSLALTTDRSVPSMGAYIRTTFDPALKRFGLRPAAGEPPSVSMMRPAMMHLLARAGRDARVLIYAESLSRAFRANPTSIPPSMIEPAIVLGAMRGDRALFDEYRHRFETTHVPIERAYYLAGLGTFRDPALHAAALDYALHGPLRPQETLMIPNAMALNALGAESRSNAVYSDDVAQWMMDHYDDLRAKMPPNFSARLVGLGSGCDPGRVQQLVDFFHDPKRQSIGVDQTLRRLVDSIHECSGIHTREAMVLEHMFLSVDSAP